MLLGVLALLIGACGSDDQSSGGGGGGDSGPKTLRVASLPVADLGAYFYALDEGLFTKHGLEVRDTSVTGGAAGIAAMTGGSVDLTYTNNVSALLSSTKGLPLKIVSGANENTPKGKRDMAAMIVGKGVDEPGQLAGSTVGTNALNNINWLYERAWLRKEGVDPGKLKFLEIDFPDQPTALSSDRIKATLIPEPFATQLRDKGSRSLGYPYRIGPGGRTFIGSFVATPDFAAKDADAVKRFRAGLDDAIAAIGDPANGDKLAAAIAKHTQLSTDAVGEITLPTYTTEISRPLLEDMARLMKQEGVLGDEAPDLDKLIAKP